MSRKSSDEIINLMFNAIEKLKITTISGIVKEMNLAQITVENYVGRLMYIQNRPKIGLIRNSSGERFYVSNGEGSGV